MSEAAAEDSIAAFDLLNLTGAEGPPSDPFDARDPDYIRATAPALRTMSDIYFRAEISGMDHIPAEGPVLLVGNHSGGTMIADSFVFSQDFYEHFGPDRLFHQLAHDIGIPPEKINYHCAGINHMAFYLRFERNGEDLYPRIRKVVEEGRVPDWNRVRYEMLTAVR